MQLKHTVVALAAAGLLSVQAHAGEMQVEAAIQPAQTVAAFTDADLQALFEASDKPMQLAALSQQEMRETEGALLPFLIGAGIGLATYAAPLAISAWRAPTGSFTGNFTNSWDTRQAVFSSGVGALSGGLTNIALRGTGAIINYPATTFLKSFHTPTQQFVNNQVRTYTTAPGLSIQGTAFAGSYGANSWYRSLGR